MSLKIVATSFITLDAQNRAVKTSTAQEFSLHVEVPPVSQNTMVTPWAAREMIREFFVDIWDDAHKQNEPIGVAFDKQTLNLILAQNGCEGIRFSFCKFEGAKTLVAFGTNKDGKFIGEPMFKKDFAKNTVEVPPPGSEQGHKTTLKEFKETIGEELYPNFDKITDEFIFKGLR